MADELPVGELQRVGDPEGAVPRRQVLILDEPTGVLTPQEADRLMRMLRLKRRGTTCC